MYWSLAFERLSVEAAKRGPMRLALMSIPGHPALLSNVRAASKTIGLPNDFSRDVKNYSVLTLLETAKVFCFRIIQLRLWV